MCEKETVLWLIIGGCENYEENGGMESVMSSVMSTTQVKKKNICNKTAILAIVTIKSSLFGLHTVITSCLYVIYVNIVLYM